MIFSPARADLLVREVGDELVVHVAARKTFHSLDARSAAVFRAVDGRRDVDDVAAEAGTDAETVAAVLAELADHGIVRPPARFDRRALLRRGGVVLAGTGIATIAAPMARAAASTAGPRISIRSSANAALYITESATAGGLATMTAPTTNAEKRLATFVQSTALSAGSGTRVSYQSLDRTGFFLRHGGFLISVQQNNSSGLFANDATFRLVTALNGNATMTSFESVNYAGYYIVRTTDDAGSGLQLLTAPDAGRASFFVLSGGLA